MSEPKQLNDDEVRNITSILIDGLNTDGAHHKQWALEEVLKRLVPDEFQACKASWQWERGIAP